jgi:two-component system chemotaxis response regulator CheY
MRILVVDDSSTMRRIIIKVLSGLGFTDVVEAADGAKAVKAAEDTQISLMLMDWNMPELAGIDAVRQIRAKGNKTPIVMVTTEAEKRRVVEAIQAGINDYLVKPFTPEQLQEKIRKHAGGGKEA